MGDVKLNNGNKDFMAIGCLRFGKKTCELNVVDINYECALVEIQ